MFPNTVTDQLPDPLVKQACELSPEERAELFLQYVFKTSEVWLLAGENGYVMIDSGAAVHLPVWPHRDLALAWQAQSGQTAQPTALALSEFVDTWLPGLAANQTDVVVFPAGPGQESLELPAEELKQNFSADPADQG